MADQADREAELQHLRTIVARVRQAVDVGPVGSCCERIIRAALNPPSAGHDEGATGT
ncbi:hypothetical protein ACWFRT_13850 [Streptomyces anulatus]